MTEVALSGPVFDGGEWGAVMADGVPELENTVATDVLEMWRDTLDYNIQVNRGVYIGATRVERVDNITTVSDGGPDAGRTGLYGPWLEGTGSRNAPVTRFKGYRSAETTAQRAQDSVDTLAEEPLGVIVKELNR